MPKTHSNSLFNLECKTMPKKDFNKNSNKNADLGSIDTYCLPRDIDFW